MISSFSILYFSSIYKEKYSVLYVCSWYSFLIFNTKRLETKAETIFCFHVTRYFCYTFFVAYSTTQKTKSGQRKKRRKEKKEKNYHFHGRHISNKTCLNGLKMRFNMTQIYTFIFFCVSCMYIFMLLIWHIKRVSFSILWR